jgi:hypothetical protein
LSHLFQLFSHYKLVHTDFYSRYVLATIENVFNFRGKSVEQNFEEIVCVG